jgi:hypothetical protein
VAAASRLTRLKKEITVALGDLRDARFSRHKNNIKNAEEHFDSLMDQLADILKDAE